MHLYWHHESNWILKETKNNIYRQSTVGMLFKGKGGWEYQIVASIVLIKSELPCKALRAPGVILNFIS